MALIVGTDTYVTGTDLTAYATARGITLLAQDPEILLTKAMDYLETRDWIGGKTQITQPLKWPRVICRYGEICEYDAITVPKPIKDAQCIAAILIDKGYDLQPVVDRAVKREKVDVLEVEYMDTAASEAQYRSLQDILRPFLNAGIRGMRI